MDLGTVRAVPEAALAAVVPGVAAAVEVEAFCAQSLSTLSARDLRGEKPPSRVGGRVGGRRLEFAAPPSTVLIKQEKD